MAAKSNEDVEEVNATRQSMTLVPVTGAIYHNGLEKPTERWSFELGLNLSEDKLLYTFLQRLEKGYGIKDRCAALNIASSSFRFQQKILHRNYLSGLKAGSFLLTARNNGIIAFQKYLGMKENL